MSERTEDAERRLNAQRQSAEGIVGPGNRKGEIERKENWEPARQAKAPESETLDLNARRPR